MSETGVFDAPQDTPAPEAAPEEVAAEEVSQEASESPQEATEEAAEAEDLGALEIDFEIPEGLEHDEARSAEFTGQMKAIEDAVLAAGGDRAKVREAIISGAKDIASGHIKSIQGATEKALQTFDQQRQADMKALESHAELGGEKLEQTLTRATLAAKTLGSPELSKKIVAAGLDNNPDLIGMLAKVGGLLEEADASVGTAKQVDAGKSLAERMYPNN